MRAILQPEYGTADTLVVDDVDTPAVGDDDVLVRVRATSLNFGDKMTLLGKPYLFRPLVFGPRRPKHPVAGLSGAGVVEAVGARVTRFAPGDEVFGELSGGCAEYGLASENLLAHKPSGLPFEQAATLPIAATTALQGLRDSGEVGPGKKVLINGASGGVGTFAIQIAKALGAEVTAVCSTRNVEQARSLGADEVIDYTREDFTEGGRRFDVMFDLVGNRRLRERRSVLKPEGVYVSSFGQGGGNWVGPLGRIFRVAVTSMVRPHKVKVLAATTEPADLLVVARMVEAGQVTPVIEETYPLDEGPEAFRTMLEGHAQGKLVITA